MKKSLFLLFAVISMAILSGCSSSEPELFSSIYGTISDSATGEPIQNATIMLTPGGKTTISGSDGSYQFDNLDPHQYTILVQKEGYVTNRKSANAVAGETVKADIPLTKVN